MKFYNDKFKYRKTDKLRKLKSKDPKKILETN